MSSKEEIKESNIKKIKKEIPFIDIKQYSHNIIGLCLRSIAEAYGNNEECNKIIVDLGLDELGWVIIEK
jgi:hypothetical protein